MPQTNVFRRTLTSERRSHDDMQENRPVSPICEVGRLQSCEILKECGKGRTAFVNPRNDKHSEAIRETNVSLVEKSVVQRVKQQPVPRVEP